MILTYPGAVKRKKQRSKDPMPSHLNSSQMIRYIMEEQKQKKDERNKKRNEGGLREQLKRERRRKLEHRSKLKKKLENAADKPANPTQDVSVAPEYSDTHPQKNALQYQNLAIRM